MTKLLDNEASSSLAGVVIDAKPCLDVDHLDPQILEYLGLRAGGFDLHLSKLTYRKIQRLSRLQHGRFDRRIVHGAAGSENQRPLLRPTCRYGTRSRRSRSTIPSPGKKHQANTSEPSTRHTNAVKSVVADKSKPPNAAPRFSAHRRAPIPRLQVGRYLWSLTNPLRQQQRPEAVLLGRHRLGPRALLTGRNRSTRSHPNSGSPPSKPASSVQSASIGCAVHHTQEPRRLAPCPPRPGGRAHAAENTRTPDSNRPSR